MRAAASRVCLWIACAIRPVDMNGSNKKDAAPKTQCPQKRRGMRSHETLLLAVSLLLLLGTAVLTYRQQSVSPRVISITTGPPAWHRRSSLSQYGGIALRQAADTSADLAPAWQQHTFLILQSPDNSLQPELESYLEPFRQYPQAFAITSLEYGAAARHLAAQHGVEPEELPVIMYLPPAWETGGQFVRAEVFQPQKQAATAAGKKSFATWLRTAARATLDMYNDRDEGEVCFFWVDPSGEEFKVGCRGPKSDAWISDQVALLDTFTVRTINGTLLDKMTVLYSGIFVASNPGTCPYLVDPSCEVPKLPFPTDEKILARREQNQVQRRQMIIDLPATMTNYTKVGFEKRKAPLDVWHALRGFLDANRNRTKRELWEVDNIYTSQFDAPTLVLPLTDPLEHRIFEDMKVELQKWAGDVPLISTAMYGIRIYTTRSRLELHVDRKDTHIVSAIINVDQDVVEPWPLQIRDHAGKQYNVTMEPGDMVMYEGAACEHGREVPLNGRFFANVFVHFKVKK